MKHQIISVFQDHSNHKIAQQQTAYLKSKFKFFGLKAPIRRDLQRPFLIQQNLPEKEVAFLIVKELWQEPQRELHYFAQEFFLKYVKQLDKKDISIIEYLITYNSWWDTVDFIATKLLAVYFRLFPEERKKKV